jgi:hypothetical protein
MSELRGNRQVAIVLALVLLAVPTFAVLFPGLVHRTDRAVRIVVMLLWLMVAFVVAVAAQPHQQDHRDGTGRGGPHAHG